MDKCYFGKIYCYLLDDENKGFIVFQEIKYKFEKENESIFDNEENGKYIFSSSFLSHKLNKSKINPEYQNKFKRMNKNVIIHLRDIDEIIEKRFLLMWQGVEIYLKNGKMGGYLTMIIFFYLINMEVEVLMIILNTLFFLGYYLLIMKKLEL